MSKKGDYAAGQELLEIKQTGTTREYANKFRTLVSRAGWNDTAAKSQFYSGLSDEVKDIICMKDEPNRLEEYMKRTQDIDERLSERKEEKREAYRFFALSWKTPQEVDSDYRENLRRTYSKDLRLLLHCLPPRFHQIIQKCLSSMEPILSLPMVLLHRDFGTCKIIVDRTSCRLTGIID
jgi:hypothetical protein